MQLYQDLHHCFIFDKKETNQIFIPCASHPLQLDDSSCSSSCSSIILSPIERNFVPPPRNSNPILNDPLFCQLHTNISPTNMICYSTSISSDSSFDDCFSFE
ncbi:hypothetical protein ENUP19_0298G0010 [Entamoeba nuttalli]|uniref:Uncharacterized protein n=2 Tax=Entamoeba nuttalli TaxID=412467 RepID=K2I1A1_ENTNP|nr:hypothetical protein ENU1_018440 [Entamoeba nuttalli P19]EKE42525.1 hypothetical protein ENU1_018440 [Entamoeba nuttalli P19]|eukprot:XP_008855145.1 hypothetical protein ENU1_018440 [Entamoeba nuttalli P19]